MFIWRRILTTIAAGAVVLGVLIVLPRWLLIRRFSRVIYTPQTAPIGSVAVVFGAGLRRDGSPTTVLADRVRTAAMLYAEGRADRILMSGASGTPRGSEPEAMRRLALELGVPDEAILLDQQGVRTFATCSRVRDVFGIRRALLVTQRYHLPRALAICQGLGIEASGVAADLHPYGRITMRYWTLREIPATLVALWETALRQGDCRAASPGFDAEVAGLAP